MSSNTEAFPEKHQNWMCRNDDVYFELVGPTYLLSHQQTIDTDMSTDSISAWISLLKDGDQDAAQNVFDHFFHRLVGLAKSRLIEGQRRASDEEDVALSAFNSFFAGANRGNFPKLIDRNDLWKLLLVITSRKAADHVNRERAQKRGGGDVRGESVFLQTDELGNPPGIGNVAAEPTPEFAENVVEVCSSLFNQLESPELKRVALLRMEGYNDSQIAGKLGCTRSTVQRRLQLIRRVWKREVE